MPSAMNESLEQITIWGKSYPYVRNPTVQELIGFLHRYTHGEARITITPGEVFVWSAHNAIHGDMRGFLQEQGEDLNRFVDGVLSQTDQFAADAQTWSVPRRLGPLWYELDMSSDTHVLPGNPVWQALRAGLERMGVEPVPVRNPLPVAKKPAYRGISDDQLMRELGLTEAMDQIVVAHVTPSRNVKRILQRGLEPRLGKRSRDADEGIPAIFVFLDLETLDNAMSNWLGEEFEGVPLSILTMTVPRDWVQTGEDAGAGFEGRIHAQVPARLIRVAVANADTWTGTPIPGLPSGLTEAQHQWETPAFQRWFGRSQARDILGRPQVYYHGTAMDFDAFSLNPPVVGSGDPLNEPAIFLTKYPANASTFADVQGANYDDPHPDAQKVHHQGAVYPCYVRIERPYHSGMDHYDSDQMAKEIAHAKRRGHDGIIFAGFPARENGHEDGALCVFDPAQIKSAVGNSGTFSRRTPKLVEAMSERISRSEPR
jgi:hypothetical protein